MLDITVLRRWILREYPRAVPMVLQTCVILLLHLMTIPQLLTVLMALTDRLPHLDLVMLAWGGLIALFVQHLIQRNTWLTSLNALGFMCQSILCALIFFQRG